MASASRLPKHLRIVLGDDAGAELVTLLEQMRTERRHADALHREQLARIDQHFDQLERRFDRVEDRIGALDAKLGDVKADLMKWSFVFWVGAVGAIAALAGVLS